MFYAIFWKIIQRPTLYFSLIGHILVAKIITVAIVGTAITLEREPSKKKQKTDTKKDAKRIKSDNFTRSNREIFDKLMIGWHHNYFVF